MFGLSIIKSFQCNRDVEKFIEDHSFRLIGSGSEGSCYQGYDGKVYKYIDMPLDKEYDPEEMITEDEVSLPSFAFPEELYSVNYQLRGYRTKRVKKDIFSVENTSFIESLASLDFEKVSSAYKLLLEDVKTLSCLRIVIFDMAMNLMFDGEKMVAIDTCGYKRVSYPCLDENIHSLNYAIEALFRMWLFSKVAFDYRIEGVDIDGYLQRLQLLLVEDLNMNIFQKKKV